MAKFDFIIGDDGKARAVSTMEILFDDAEECEKWKTRMANGEGRLMHWVPVTYSEDEETGELMIDDTPEDDESVLCTDGENVWWDVWDNEYGFESNMDVTAWMRMPTPYRKEGTT